MTPSRGPSLQRNRLSSLLFLLLGLLLTGLALWVRVRLFRSSEGGRVLCIGPDAGDWGMAAVGLLRGDPTLLQSNRYPLAPWLAALLARGLDIRPIDGLFLLSVTAGSLLPWATFSLARRYVSWIPALGAGLYVAFKPGYIASSLYTIAYPFAALFFVLLVRSLLQGLPTEARLAVFPGVASQTQAMPARARPTPSDTLRAFMVGLWSDKASLLSAALTSASCVATLQQGFLSLLAVLPLAFFVGRSSRAYAALLGAAGGLGVAEWLHPQRFDTLVWMLHETRRYLGGNIAEETARAQLSYATAWQAWARLTFQLQTWQVLLLLGLALLGLLLAFWRPIPADSPSPDSRPVASPLLSRGAVLGLAWALGPLAVLLAFLGSSHHLLHLEPLLLVAAMLGLDRLVGGLLGGLGRLSARTFSRGTTESPANSSRSATSSASTSRPLSPLLAWGRPILLGAAVLTLGLSAKGSYARWDPLAGNLAEAQHEEAVARALTQLTGQQALILVAQTDRPTAGGRMTRLAWALPRGIDLREFSDTDGPHALLQQAALSGRAIFVLNDLGGQSWHTGPYLLEALGPPQVMPVFQPGQGPQLEGDGAVRLTLVSVKGPPSGGQR